MNNTTILCNKRNCLILRQYQNIDNDKYIISLVMYGKDLAIIDNRTKIFISKQKYANEALKLLNDDYHWKII